MPISSFGPTVLLVNTHARAGQQSFDLAQKELRHCGVQLEDAKAVREHDALTDCVDDAVKAGARLIMVGGGDGTVSAVAGRLAGKNVALGVLPLGTGNDFARGLGIPVQLRQACSLVTHGKLTPVDVGLANGRVFLNAVSLGLPVQLAQRLDPDLKKRYGKLAYPVAALSALRALKPFHVRIHTREHQFEGAVLQVVVGNGRFHGAGQVIAPKATLDDRRLDAYAVLAHEGNEAPRHRHLKDILLLARVGWMGRRGKHVQHPRVLYFRTQEVRLTTQQDQSLNVDGELWGQAPVTFQVGASALQVLVP